jgi:lactate permease
MLVAVIGNGWKSFKRALPPVLLLSVVMGIVQYLLATNGLWTLGSTGAGLAGLGGGVLTAAAAGLSATTIRALPELVTAESGQDAGKSLWLVLICYALLIVLAFGVNLIKPAGTFLSQVKLSLDFPEVSTGFGWTTPAGSGRAINLFGHPGAILLYTCMSFLYYLPICRVPETRVTAAHPQQDD